MFFGKSESYFIQENIPLEEVFEHLRCTKEGLSNDAVQERLEMFGYNKLEEKKVSGEGKKKKKKKFFRPFILAGFLYVTHFPPFFDSLF